MPTRVTHQQKNSYNKNYKKNIYIKKHLYSHKLTVWDAVIEATAVTTRAKTKKPKKKKKVVEGRSVWASTTQLHNHQLYSENLPITNASTPQSTPTRRSDGKLGRSGSFSEASAGRHKSTVPVRPLL